MLAYKCIECGVATVANRLKVLGQEHTPSCRIGRIETGLVCRYGDHEGPHDFNQDHTLPEYLCRPCGVLLNNDDMNAQPIYDAFRYEDYYEVSIDDDSMGTIH